MDIFVSQTCMDNIHLLGSRLRLFCLLGNYIPNYVIEKVLRLKNDAYILFLHGISYFFKEKVIDHTRIPFSILEQYLSFYL